MSVESKDILSDCANSTNESTTPLDKDEPIVPDSYWGGEGGTVPIFKPTMAQFRSFPDFIKKIDHYGMRAGIVKVIPPQEWLDSLPDLDDKVKSIRVQNAIEQNFAGSGGAFRQMNLEKHRSYSLPAWRKICDSSEHQPPAKRGEARRMGGRKADRVERRPRNQPPLTPPPTTDSDSGSPEPQDKRKQKKKSKAKVRVSSEDAEYANFDYRIDDNDQYTPERCQELEKSYWKSLTFNNPMYGADLPGSLFDDTTESWNVAKLDNILNRLGVTLPGVNSAYLYLGMWKATFSWHVEDMDLYSINYIHFGAPKQWYSVSQEDNQKFEKVMKDIFPNDARHCGQFMRHKTFGASPARLAQHDLHVNKLVHYEKEFVITFPYGYHSGYNLGYNCAESVNFATEEWLEYGKVAQKCECVADAVSIDVNDIIRAVNGTNASDYEENEILTPPASGEDSSDESSERRTYSEFDRSRRPKTKKRSRDLLYDTTPVAQYKKLSDRYHARKPNGVSHSPATKPALKKIKLSMPKAPCALCNKAPVYEDLLDAGNGRKVHRICADFVPETKIIAATGPGQQDTVTGYADIDKARMALKCTHCKVSAGACFQCSSPKCVRAFHGTCAYDAGVLVQKMEVTEEQPLSHHFLCKSHRPRRPPVETLEFDQHITHYASSLSSNVPVQAQFASGHVFSGLVRENRRSERTVVIEVGDEGDKIEVNYQWILAPPKRPAGLAKQTTSQSQKQESTVMPEQANVPQIVHTLPKGQPIEEQQIATTLAPAPSNNVAPAGPSITHHAPAQYINPYSVAQGYYRPPMSNMAPYQAPAGRYHLAMTAGINPPPAQSWPPRMTYPGYAYPQYAPGVPQYFKIGADTPSGPVNRG